MPTDLAHDIGVPGLSGPGKTLHTGVWHGDRVFDLPVPVDWQVTALWPPTPPPLTDYQIAACLSRPSGQESIARASAGKSRPLIVVDSTLEPTPVARLLPQVIRQFQQAGFDPSAIRILVATGDQGAPRPESLIKKLGPAAADCELLIHDPDRHETDLGTISPGIRLFANREVVSSDFVVGIEGIYPDAHQRYPFFSTLAGAVLGAETIRALASRRFEDANGSAETERDQIHRTIEERLRIHTTLSAQVDAERSLIRLACGDPRIYYPVEAAFARATFGAPVPDDADIVVANAYPADLSLRAVLSRGLRPTELAASGASRIVLASCAEGLGAPAPPKSWWSSAERAARAPARFWRAWRSAHHARPHRHPIWLYRPSGSGEAIGCKAKGLQAAPTWDFIVEAVRREQIHKRFCRVVLYPCSPLQVLMSEPGVSAL
jgi:Lactate racemase N-terminal domain